MGFLDRLLTRVGKAPAPAPAPAAPVRDAKVPEGPMHLCPGDAVTHYRTRFAVAGLRCLEGKGPRIWQYCLETQDGARVVLAADEGPSPTLWLERTFEGSADWNADEVSGVCDAPLRLKYDTRMKVRTWADAGVPGGSRAVEVRRYEDEGGDHVLVLEQYGPHREARLGEPVFEAELEIERVRTAAPRSTGVRSKALGGSGSFEEQDDPDVVKGTPRAAALALDRNVADGGDAAGPAVDVDPNVYDDERWADDEDAQAPAGRTRFVPPAQRIDEEDEWASASQHARGEDEGSQSQEA